MISENQRFGLLTTMWPAGYVEKRIICWMCACDCGKYVHVRRNNLQSGNTTSCGCSHKIHGLSNTPEYNAYHEAKGRCRRKKGKTFKNYVARGIKFLIPSVEEMIAEIGFKPEPHIPYKWSLDRIDNDGNYELGNIRWADRSQQMRNTRKRVMPKGLKRPGRTRNALLRKQTREI